MKPPWKWPIQLGLGIGIGILLGAQACNAGANIGTPMAVDAKHLTRENIRVDGSLVRAYRLTDRDGEHVLVLSRKSGPSPAAPKSGRVERVDLYAEYYQQLANGQWKQLWTIRDQSDCPGLDVEGDFFLAQVGFSDLNKDGKAEVTVPYRLFCGAIRSLESFRYPGIPRRRPRTDRFHYAGR